jgi:hypothetical protein
MKQKSLQDNNSPQAFHRIELFSFPAGKFKKAANYMMLCSLSISRRDINGHTREKFNTTVH